MEYVDDLIIFGLDPVSVRAAQVEYIEEAAKVNLPAKPAKVKLPSKDAVDCLGVEVHGTEHTVSPRADKIDLLRRDTYHLLQRGRATGREMAQLVGRWTWLMLVSRPALACFNHVYRYIDTVNGKSGTIWPSVATELWCVARIAPMLLQTISNKWATHVLAVDASLSGQGVVAAVVPADEVEHAASITGTDSITAALVSEAKPLGVINPARTAINQSITNTLLNCKWTTWIAAPWHTEEHINSFEIHTAVRRIIS